MLLGIQVTKVHQALSFTQKDILSDYTNLNSHLRALATDEFGKAFRKLLNNALFGRMMMNVRNMKQFKLLCKDNIFVEKKQS